MSKSLLILTPDKGSASYQGRWQDVLDAFKSALSRLDLDIEDAPWSDRLNRTYDLVCPILSWGYHNDPEAFKAALNRMALSGQKLLNPALIIGWNVDKHYLRDLADAGVRIIPTIFAGTLTLEAMKAARTDFGQDTLVIKPSVSAGAKNTFVWDKEGLPECDNNLMIQPFMSAIQTEGEWSLLFFGGEFSHSVLKTPKANDFRSQPDYDARIQSLRPPPEALDLAHEALDFVGRDQLLYARVDMVRDDKGQFCLMELELIEPDLYLKYDEAAPLKLAHAVAHIMGLKH